MKTRILAALVGIPPVLAAVFLAGPATFGAIVLALALLALHEYLRLCAVEPLLSAAVLACAVPVLIAVPAGGAPGVGAAALLVLALLSLWRVDDPARRLRGLAEGVLGLCYIGYAMGCLWLLRMETAHGAAWLFLVLGATWAGDSAAYFVGSRFGRRRFAPALSPNKTWAGAVGGLAGSLAGGMLAQPLSDRRSPGHARRGDRSRGRFRRPARRSLRIALEARQRRQGLRGPDPGSRRDPRPDRQPAAGHSRRLPHPARRGSDGDRG